MKKNDLLHDLLYGKSARAFLRWAAKQRLKAIEESLEILQKLRNGAKVTFDSRKK